MSAAGRYTDQQWQWVAHRYRDGYSTAELAEFLCISEKSVRVHLKRRGIRFRHSLLPLETRRASFERIAGQK